MAITLPDFPLVNGNLYSWASVSPVFTGIPGAANLNVQRGMKEISYKGALDPGAVYGAGSPRIVGRVRGQWKPEASFTMYKIYFEYLLQALGAGAMEQVFNLLVHYRESLSTPICTDTIVGARIKGFDESHNDGSDALVVKVDLSIIDILKNGVSLLAADPS